MRWLVRSVSALIMLIVLLGVMVVLMPKDPVLDQVAQRFQAATGHRISFGDSARVTLWPPGISAGPVQVTAANDDSTPMLEAERLQIGLRPLALLDGVAQITSLRLDAPQITLQRAADGQVNWAGRGPGMTGDDHPDLPFEIRDGRLHVLDQGAGVDLQLSALNLTTALPAPGQPATLRASATLNGQPLQAEAQTGDLAALLAGETAALNLLVTAGQSLLRFDGEAGAAPLQASGQLAVDLTERTAIATLTGRPFPSLPQGLGANSLNLSGTFSRSAGGRIVLRNAELLADGQRLTGEAEWQQQRPRPRLIARLATDILRIAPREAAALPMPWPDTALQTGALGALDAEILLSAGQIEAGPLRLGQTEARLVIDNARAVLLIPQSAAWGGSLSGQIVVNARTGLSASADLVLSGADTAAVLRQTTGSAILSGPGELRLRLLAVGNNLAAMMRSLGGEASLALGTGALGGLDVAGMMRTLDPGYVGPDRSTAFEALNLTAQIRDGVATISDLALSGPLFQSGGAGQIDLGAQTFGFRLLPRLITRSEAADGSLSETVTEVPVLVAGPWARPEVRLDLEWLARQRAEAEAARAEELARQRLEELAQ